MQKEDTRLWERTKKTIVFVTHDIEEAVYLGDRVVVLTARPGRIREEVKIELPRPRSLEIKKSMQCHEYRNYVWDLIRSESHKRYTAVVCLGPGGGFKCTDFTQLSCSSQRLW